MNSDKRGYDVDEEDRKERKRAKKAAKKVEKVAKMLGYSNGTNPFGDSNLLQPFVWKKKTDLAGPTAKDDGGDAKRLYLLEEIEKVRKRRTDRENELEEIDRLRNEEQRLRESAVYNDWERKEEEFHLHQTKERSRLRLLDNRQKTIDLIAKNMLILSAAKDKAAGKRDTDLSILELDVELRNPVALLETAQDAELEGLLDDIESFLELEKTKGGRFELFWESLKTIVSHRSKRRGQQTKSVHKEISADVEGMLLGKSPSELDDLERDVRKSWQESPVDSDYWEALLDEIILQRAKTLVKRMHVELLQAQLQLLADERKHAKESGENVGLSGIETARIEEMSRNSSAELAAMHEEKMKTIGDKEENMQVSDEIMLPGATYWWQDKYRPRKPRYFNRVKTGWDRSKYNLTHYDYDNPPPKVIQGYKFTIFYPDLIDRSKTPKYTLEKCDDNTYCFIRFHAGPPYEDVAFKIINREWDIHRRSGFKSVFDRGVLQLYFNFKRSFYRR